MVLALAAACAAAPKRAPPPAPPPAKADTWLSLGDLQMHEGAPSGCFVRGAVGYDGLFVPAGDEIVCDAPAPPADALPGYLELSTMRFMGASEGRAPVPPYVEGRITDAGFVPTAKKIRR